MGLTRRRFVSVSSVAVGTLAFDFPAPALAQTEPLRIGWLTALTGPSSAPGIGMNRGVLYIADKINKAGGVKGRPIEIVTRDSQGDPTKAVNAVQEMISNAKVHAVCGPSLSGESLAVTPIMARAKMPNVHACVVDSLIDPRRFPNAFRTGPSGTQMDDAVRMYTLDILKKKKVAVIGDSTGYGVATSKASVAAFTAAKADVVYHANIDPALPDMTADLTRARNAGAEALIVWTGSTGMVARMLNTRSALRWDVPVVGHPSLGAGEVGKLIERPSNWDNVFAAGYRMCSYDASGQLPERTARLVADMKKQIDLADTLLWWVASGVDGIELIAKAVSETGSSSNEAIIRYWNSLKDYPAYLGDLTFSETEHNGLQTRDVVMSLANSMRDGTFRIAPGYA